MQTRMIHQKTKAWNLKRTNSSSSNHDLLQPSIPPQHRDPTDMSSSHDPTKRPAEEAQLGFHANQSQDEFDFEFFGDVLKRSDANSDVIRRQAELFARRGEYQEALQLDLKLVERFPRDHLVRYNLACSFAMIGERQQSIAALAEAINLGYDDFAHIEADSDLDALRDESSFQELLRRHGISDL